MRQFTRILLTGIFAVGTAGCAASLGPPPTPVLLPTLAPFPSPVFVATPTPDQTAIQAQVDIQRSFDAAGAQHAVDDRDVAGAVHRRGP